MNKKRIKKIAIWSVGIFAFLVVVLMVHIYWVTRPRVDAHTRILARIDLNQPIDMSASQKIANWLYGQKGVDHVVCNEQSDMVLFTYAPLVANGNEIANQLKSTLNYPNSKRFVPSAKDLAASCPVAGASFSYKVYKFFKNIF